MCLKGGLKDGNNNNNDSNNNINKSICSSSLTTTRTSSSSAEQLTTRELDQQSKEYEISREYKWFMVRFFNDHITLSGDRSRYVFVDESRYGIVMGNVVFFILAHIAYMISFIWILPYSSGAIYCYIFSMCMSLGITAGVHRLWSHKSYVANFQLRLLLAFCFTTVGQNDIYTWCRDHRLHHKFTETDADPHNSRRGIFFAHVGWLLTKKHPDVLIKGKTIDNSDLIQDPIVYWNRKLYILWYIMLRIFWPIAIPYLVLRIPAHVCIMGNYSMYVANLHSTWFVNSAAHMFGDRPYNSKIQPRENFFVALFGYNEGFHNYHHQFPWDWRIAEHGISFFDPGKWFIQMMSKIGWATNLKQASTQLIKITRDKVTSNRHDHQDSTTTQQLNATNTQHQHQDSLFYVHDHPYHAPHHYAAHDDDDDDDSCLAAGTSSDENLIPTVNNENY